MDGPVHRGFTRLRLIYEILRPYSMLRDNKSNIKCAGYSKYTSMHYVHIKQEIKGQNLCRRNEYYLSI